LSLFQRFTARPWCRPAGADLVDLHLDSSAAAARVMPNTQSAMH